jgi:hypothetical protein
MPEPLRPLPKRCAWTSRPGRLSNPSMRLPRGRARRPWARAACSR